LNILIYSTNSHYLNKFVGGAETSLKLIAEKFTENEHKVFYLTHESGKFVKLKKRKINNVNVIFFTPQKLLTRGNQFLLRCEAKFRTTQIRYLLKVIIKKHKIDIVHTYNEYPNTYDVLKVREKSKLKFKTIIRISGLYWAYQIRNKLVLKQSIEWVYNNIDCINFLSKASKELFEQEIGKLGIQIINQRYTIIDIGLNFDVFSKKWKHKSAESFKIVMIARFSKYQKRQDLLIKAFQLLEEGYEIVFIGDGPEKNDIESFVINNKIQNITFHDHIPQSEIAEILLQSSLFTLITEYEGVPKSLLEAMAMGVPILVSDVLPLNEYVKDNHNGFLCNNEPLDIAKKIEQIRAMGNQLEKISAKEISYVNEYYDPDKNINIYIEEFERLIND